MKVVPQVRRLSFERTGVFCSSRTPENAGKENTHETQHGKDSRIRSTRRIPGGLHCIHGFFRSFRFLRFFRSFFRIVEGGVKKTADRISL